MTETTTRAIDSGGPLFPLPELADPTAALPACGRGVCVETPFDLATTNDQIVLSLRRAEWHDGGPADVEFERARVIFSLRTGRCAPGDAQVDRFPGERWIDDGLHPHQTWLRERARRLVMQRDRTSCFDAFPNVPPGTMVAHDRLFPGDWDLLLDHEGCTYWAVEHHCTTCACNEVMVMLYAIDPPRADYLGDLRVDFSARRFQPVVSHANVGRLRPTLRQGSLTDRGSLERRRPSERPERHLRQLHRCVARARRRASKGSARFAVLVLELTDQRVGPIVQRVRHQGTHLASF